ncbi:MAG: hypothetical protein LUC98_07850 [Lachnospiraceae bacterium]|nr:hypothetical protein [Lachnospiraceae bacterium]
MRKFSFVMAVMMAVMALTGCSVSVKQKSDPLPEETIEEFEDAVNNMDVQGMLDCMDEDMQSTITSSLDLALGLVSAVTGVKISDYVKAEDLLNVAPLLQEFIPYTDTGEYGEVDYEVTATYIKGSKATVYFTELYSGENMVINMSKEDDKWLFSVTTTEIDPDEADRVIIAGEDSEDSSGSTSDVTVDVDQEDVLRQIYEQLGIEPE